MHSSLPVPPVSCCWSRAHCSITLLYPSCLFNLKNWGTWKTQIPLWATQCPRLRGPALCGLGTPLASCPLLWEAAGEPRPLFFHRGCGVPAISEPSQGWDFGWALGSRWKQDNLPPHPLPLGIWKPWKSSGPTPSFYGRKSWVSERSSDLPEGSLE